MSMAKRVCSFLVFALTICGCSALSMAEVVDKIAIVVNNEVITQGEVDRILAPIYEQYRALYYGDELVNKLAEAKKKIMDQLIEDRLILSEAKRQNISVDEKEVDERVEEVRKRFDSNAKFEEAVKEQGITLRDLRNRYRDQLMTRRLIDQKIGSRITISPVEISDYYNKHINEYMQQEEIKLSNILIRPTDNMDSERAYMLAFEILRRLREGCDFSGLAKEYSAGPNAANGGTMGYVKRGDLLPEIEQKVFNLKVGDISSVIQTGLGYHIFKVEDRKERRLKGLSEVRRDVENAIFMDKVKDKIRGWVEHLRKNAYIEFK